MDCADAPDRQELSVASLVQAEAVAILTILKKGGSAVLKVFTLFEAYSISLIYLFINYFEKVM